MLVSSPHRSLLTLSLIHISLIAELAAKKDNAPGSAAQTVGDLYNIAMDSVKLNQEGVGAIKAELAAIDALKDKGEIYAYIRCV